MPKAKGAESDPGIIDGLDRAIHSPARLKILAILSVAERADFTFLLNQTGLTRGNLSSHLSVLEEAGYIDVNKEFVERVPRTLVRLNPAGKTAIQNYRDNMQDVLDELLRS
ncbi:MAG: transcriptional regulator [Chloroflexi bacterium]|nr:transcriptional regulator [Chloroflexota bacterium]